MHVISLKKLRDFWAVRPDAMSPLLHWHKIARVAEWKTFTEVRADFPAADQVGKFTVFDIGGNKYRLIAVIHFNRGKVYVRHVLTHREYDGDQWKKG